MDRTPLRTPVGLKEPLSENFFGQFPRGGVCSGFSNITYKKSQPSKHKYWIQPFSHREDFSKTAAEKCVYTEQITELDSLLVSPRVVSKVPDGVSKSWRLETPQPRVGGHRCRLQFVVDRIPYTYRVNRGVLVDRDT